MTDDDIDRFLADDYDRVVRAVAAVCGDRHRAEDAVQDALLDLWSKSHPIDSVAAWVTTVALNRSRSKWRSRSAERRACERLGATRATSGGGETAIFDGQLAAALRSLPRAQREAVALFYVLDLSVADISQRLNVTEGTIKTHLHRGRAALRSDLHSEKSSEDDESCLT